MNKRFYPIVVSIVSFILITACGFGTLASPAGSGSNAGGNFPFTPNPIDVTISPGTQEEVTFQQNGLTPDLAADTPEGVHYDLNLMFFSPLQAAEDGELLPAGDAKITMAPVLAIDGLPFSQGYLAAVQLGPEGTRSMETAILTIDIPGTYDPSELVGFAADGSGKDFHLFPAAFSSYDGTTHAEFDISHFSLYGVAHVVQSEITAQTGHPPVDPASQDEQELTPLTKIDSNGDLVALPSKIQLQLGKSYNQLVKKDIDNIASLPCGQVGNALYNHNAWVTKVTVAKQLDHYQADISKDQKAMLDRLKACIQTVCLTCLHPQKGSVINVRNVKSMMAMIDYARYLTSALNLGDEQLNYWWYLSYECAKNSGLPLPKAGGAGDPYEMGGGTTKASDLVCP